MPNQNDHVFRTREFLYVLSFTEMRQRNMDDRYCTERNVRRRPEFQPAKYSKYGFINFVTNFPAKQFCWLDLY